MTDCPATCRTSTLNGSPMNGSIRQSEGIRIEGSLYDAVFAYRGMLG